MTESNGLSADEIALYDRQIRLWGMATQLRLRSAKILIVNIGALGGEIVKNLVLGGLHSIELLDSSVAKEEDFVSQFFLPNDDANIGKLKLPLIVDNIKDLNNRVNLTTNTKSLDECLYTPEYFKKFDLVVGTELTKEEMLKLNSVTRDASIPLYIAGLHGMFGYIISDLIKHTSKVEKDLGNQPREANTKINERKSIIDVEINEESKKETVTIVDEYKSLEDIFKSKELPKQLNRRQLRRLSSCFPLTFSLFEFTKPLNCEDDINKEALKKVALESCKNFDLPEGAITNDYLDLFSKQAFTEFAPVAAILGGCLAQDVIQFLSKKESPINNVLILDCLKSEMPIYYL